MDVLKFCIKPSFACVTTLVRALTVALVVGFGAGLVGLPTSVTELVVLPQETNKKRMSIRILFFMMMSPLIKGRGAD